MKRLALVVAFWFVATAPFAAQQWPAFRGLNATGVADGKPTPAAWDVAKGENVLWKTPIPGVSVSSPIVWGDRVFVSTAVSSDPKQSLRSGQYGDVEPISDSSKHSWRLYALDRATGKVVWERIAYEGVPKTKRHPKSSQASPTPVTDGRYVIVSFGSEGLYAYDFAGKLVWKRDLGVLNSGWFYDPDYEWGLGSSPIIWKNMVIVQCDIQKNSFIAAFDVATGKPVWRTDRDEIPSWSTPSIFEVDGKAELVTQATTFTRGYDPASGKELWRFSGNSEIAIPTPIVGGGLVFIVNGYRSIQPIRAIRPGASGDITLKGEETTNASIAWSTRLGGSYIPTPIIYGNILYVLRDAGILTAYDIATGTRHYQERIAAASGGFTASPVAADGKLYLTSEDGDVYVVRAGAKYELLGKSPVGEVILASPAISNGVLFFRGVKHVIAIGQK